MSAKGWWIFVYFDPREIIASKLLITSNCRIQNVPSMLFQRNHSEFGGENKHYLYSDWSISGLSNPVSESRSVFFPIRTGIPNVVVLRGEKWRALLTDFQQTFTKK